FVAGGVDLSGGSDFGFLVTLLAYLIVPRDLGPWVGSLSFIGLCLTIRPFNGLFVYGGGLPVFIVTMGCLFVLRGATNLVSGGYPISARETDSLFHRVVGGRLGIVPDLALWMFGVMLAGGVVLAKTRFGYSVYATGGNLEAALFNGIATKRVKLIC